MKFVCSLMIALSLVGCAGIQVHPGSINTFDSVTADTLTSVKATIDSARPKLASGVLPNSLKTPMNDLITAYNTADTAYMTWRTAVSSNQDSSAALTQVQAALAAVTKALAAYTQAGGK